MSHRPVLCALSLLLLTCGAVSDRGTYREFRGLNERWTAETCRALHPALLELPQVHLHGDAHIEQFTVTEHNAGLSDFDEAGVGPAALDIVRFQASILVAQAARRDRTAPLLSVFEAGYWQGVQGRQTPQPRVVSRYRAAFREERGHRVHRLVRLMHAVSRSEQASLLQSLRPYLREMELQEHLPKRFLEPVSLGRLRVGVGSAHLVKYLVRLHGASDSPLDDEFLELKEYRPKDSTCFRRFEPSSIDRSAKTHAFGYRCFGVLKTKEMRFWTHLWPRHYREVRIGDLSVQDFEQVVFSAAAQLGAGHRASAPDADFEPMRKWQPVFEVIARALAGELLMAGRPDA